MLKNLKKMFNISCFLGLHEYIPMASMTIANVETTIRTQLVNKLNFNTTVVNTLPLPKDINKPLHVYVCPHCNKVKSGILKYTNKRAALYVKIYDKHVKCVDRYLEYYNEILEELKKPLD